MSRRKVGRDNLQHIVDHAYGDGWFSGDLPVTANIDSVNIEEKAV